MEYDTTNENAEVNQQAAASTQPEENGNSQQAGKTFTQEEVNRIIQERLNREKNKTDTSDKYQAREQELIARENTLACKEYLSEKKLPKEMLEVFGADEVDKFKIKVDKLLEAFPQIIEPIHNPVTTTTGVHSGGHQNYKSIDATRKAFGL